MQVAFMVACLLILITDSISFQAIRYPRHAVLDPDHICKKYNRPRGKLAHICKNETDLLKEVSRGVDLGMAECAYQFKSRRWNCTTMIESMKKILLKDTREAGFINAITAAGVTYAITRACTNGNLLQCSCERKTTNQDSPWQWGGCNENIKYGFRKSRDFMDARFRKRSDLKTLIRLHNNNAGRFTVKKHTRRECKCHGISGSCTLRTCWLKMPSFREVGNRLKRKFDGAKKVIAGNDGRSFIREGYAIKRPGKGDLVYCDESPDFCYPNHKTGSLGTEGRECSVTNEAVENSCDLLCCGRGFKSQIVNETVNCRCKFKWCCDVMCDVCTVEKEMNTCY